MLEKTVSFIDKVCFEDGMMVDDSQLRVCKGCGKKAWLTNNIKHKQKCEVGKVKKELRNAALWMLKKEKIEQQCLFCGCRVELIPDGKENPVRCSCGECVKHYARFSIETWNKENK
jgi:hypothetical protein